MQPRRKRTSTAALTCFRCVDSSVGATTWAASHGNWLRVQHLENPNRLPRRKPFAYPIPEFGCIYSPRVMVFRGSEETGYPFLAKPRWMSFIAAAAYNRPKQRQGRLAHSVAEKTAPKIRTVLRVRVTPPLAVT